MDQEPLNSLGVSLQATPPENSVARRGASVPKPSSDSLDSPLERHRRGPSSAATGGGNAHADYSMHFSHNQRPEDVHYLDELAALWEAGLGKPIDRLQNFSKFVPRADLIRLLVFHDLYKKVSRVQGAIMECGVHLGAGLMAWAQLSSIYEPINQTRRVVGFDTFEGFAELDGRDEVIGNPQAQLGGLAVAAEDDLKRSIKAFDRTRAINHIPRVHLVKGDATKIIPAFIESNPHTVVALLHLDFDVYQPTKVAIETFLPRMPRGGVIVFDELNNPDWPGETLAVLDTIGLKRLRIRRFPHQPQISYAVLP